MRESLTRGINQGWGFGLVYKLADETCRIDRIDNDSPMKYSAIKINDILISMNGLSCSTSSISLLETLMANNTTLDISFEKDGWRNPRLSTGNQSNVVDMTMSDSDDTESGLPPVTMPFRQSIGISYGDVIDLVSDDEDDLSPIILPSSIMNASTHTTPAGAKRSAPSTAKQSSSKKPKSSSADTSSVKIKLEFPPKGFGECDIGDEVVEVRRIDEAPSNTTDMSDGNDIEIIGGNFQSAVDMPHQRESCPKKSFSFDGMVSINQHYCANCYCYVCEVKASECTDWTRHCNATCRKASWKSERDSLKSSLAVLLPAALKTAALSIIKQPQNGYDDDDDDYDSDEYGSGYDSEDDYGYGFFGHPPRDRSYLAVERHREKLSEEAGRIEKELVASRSAGTPLSHEVLIQYLFILLSSWKQLMETYGSKNSIYDALVQIFMQYSIEDKVKAAVITEIKQISSEPNKRDFFVVLLTQKKPAYQLATADIVKIYKDSFHGEVNTPIYNGLLKSGKHEVVYALCSQSSDFVTIFRCLNEFYKSSSANFMKSLNEVCDRILKNHTYDYSLSNAEPPILIMILSKLYNTEYKRDIQHLRAISQKLLTCTIEESIRSIHLIPKYSFIESVPSSTWFSQISASPMTVDDWRAVFFRMLLVLPPHHQAQTVNSASMNMTSKRYLLFCSVNDVHAKTILYWVYNLLDTIQINDSTRVIQSLILLYKNYPQHETLDVILIEELLGAINMHQSHLERFFGLVDLLPDAFFRKHLPNTEIQQYLHVHSADSSPLLSVHQSARLMKILAIDSRPQEPVLVGITDVPSANALKCVKICWNTFTHAWKSCLKTKDSAAEEMDDFLHAMNSYLAKLLIAAKESDIFRFEPELLAKLGSNFTFQEEVSLIILRGISALYQSIKGSRYLNYVTLPNESTVKALKRIKKSTVAAFERWRTLSMLSKNEQTAVYNHVSSCLREIIVAVHNETGMLQSSYVIADDLLIENWTALIPSENFVRASEYIDEEDIRGNYAMVMQMLEQSCALLVDNTIISSILDRAPNCFLSTLGKVYDDNIASLALQFMIPPLIRNLVKAVNRDKDSGIKASFMNLCSKALDAATKISYPDNLFEKAIEIAAITSSITSLLTLLKKKYSIVSHRISAIQTSLSSSSSLTKNVQDKLVEQSLISLNKGYGNIAIPITLLIKLLKLVGLRNPSLLGTLLPWIADVCCTKLPDEMKAVINSIIKLLPSSSPSVSQSANEIVVEENSLSSDIPMIMLQSIAALKFYAFPTLANLNDYLARSPADGVVSSLYLYLLTIFFLNQVSVYEMFQIVADRFPDKGVHDFIHYLLVDKTMTPALLQSFYEIVDANAIRRSSVLSELLKVYLMLGAQPQPLGDLICTISSKLSVSASQDTHTTKLLPYTFNSYSEFTPSADLAADRKLQASTYIPTMYLHENLYRQSRIVSDIFELNISTQDRLAIIDLICKQNIDQGAYFSVHPGLMSLKPYLYKTFVNYDDVTTQSLAKQKSLFGNDFGTLLDIVRDELINSESHPRQLHILTILVNNISMQSMFPAFDHSQTSSPDAFQKEMNLQLMRQGGVLHKLIPILFRCREIVRLESPTGSVKELYSQLIGRLLEVSKSNVIIAGICDYLVNMESKDVLVQCIENFQMAHKHRDLGSASGSLHHGCIVAENALLYEIIAAALLSEKSSNGVFFGVVRTITLAAAHLFRKKYFESSILWLKIEHDFESFVKFMLARKMLDNKTVTYPYGIVDISRYLTLHGYGATAIATINSIYEKWMSFIQADSIFVKIFCSIIMDLLKSTTYSDESLNFDVLIKSLKAYNASHPDPSSTLLPVIFLLSFTADTSIASLTTALGSANVSNSYVSFVESVLMVMDRKVNSMRTRMNFIVVMISHAGLHKEETIKIIDSSLRLLQHKLQEYLKVMEEILNERTTESSNKLRSLATIPVLLELITKNLPCSSFKLISSGSRYHGAVSMATITALWEELFVHLQVPYFHKFEEMMMAKASAFLELRLDAKLKEAVNEFMRLCKNIHQKRSDYPVRWNAVVENMSKAVKKKKALQTIIRTYLA
jgi:hypothetical protein